MSIAEGLMLSALLPMPLLLGAALGVTHRAWWWGAAAAIALFNIAAIAPAPEAGQPRLAGDDVVFLLICSAIIVAVAALGHWIGRWSGGMVARRRTTQVVPD